jgi:hypothetical protein
MPSPCLRHSGLSASVWHLLYENCGIAILASLILFAYYGVGNLLMLTSGVLLLAAVLNPASANPFSPLDWAMIVILLYEAPSVWLSHFPANGAFSARVICIAVLDSIERRSK